ncbi:MAG: tail-specific protease, partial [Marivirga sp.]|nr:tail-specific protease [Marivirga sp.]
MKRIFFAGILSVVVLASGSAFGTHVGDTTQLKAKPVYGKEAKVIAYILDNNHYSKITLDDSLSEAILGEYVKSLDNNKTYFTSADIAGFEKYKHSIDDLTRSENVDVAYEIYGVFRKRFSERMNYVINNL